MAVFMPITSPSRFKRGPPELPRLMAASVWMNSSIGTMSRSFLPFALTTPTVIEACSPKGFPTAITHSPMSSSSELPSARKGTCLASIFKRPMSVLASQPTIFAGNSVPSLKVTVTLSAPWTTWLFVKM